MRTVCWQTFLMKYHSLFFRKLEKMSQNLSSAAIVIGALWVKVWKSTKNQYKVTEGKNVIIIENYIIVEKMKAKSTNYLYRHRCSDYWFIKERQLHVTDNI